MSAQDRVREKTRELESLRQKATDLSKKLESKKAELLSGMTRLREAHERERKNLSESHASQIKNEESKQKEYLGAIEREITTNNNAIEEKSRQITAAQAEADKEAM